MYTAKRAEVDVNRQGVNQTALFLVDSSQPFIFYKIGSELQLFVDKTVFLEKKAYFFGNKTVDQRSGASSKKLFFAEICCKFLAFLVFCSKNNSCFI